MESGIRKLAFPSVPSLIQGPLWIRSHKSPRSKAFSPPPPRVFPDDSHDNYYLRGLVGTVGCVILSDYFFFFSPRLSLCVLLSSRLPASRNTLVPIFVNTPFVVTFPIIVITSHTSFQLPISLFIAFRNLFYFYFFRFVLLLFFSPSLLTIYSK